jgi:predicted RNase H-like HicB family nuclease
MTIEIEHFEEADRYLRRPYARIILPESDGTFRGEIVEFPGCIATGDSAPETLANLEEVARSWLVAALAHGQNIPEPIENNNDFSGRLVIRIPKSLHKKAAWIAEREGVSLNHFITTSLSESVGEKNANMTAVFISSPAPVASFTPIHVDSNFAAVSGVSTYAGLVDYTAGKFINSTLSQTMAGGKTLALMLAGSITSGTQTVAVSGTGGTAVNYSSEGAVNMTAASTVPPNIYIGGESQKKSA